MEYCYSPIIQSHLSAGGYDMKPTAEMKPTTGSVPMTCPTRVFLVSLRMCHKGYCVNLYQNFIIDPNKVSFLVHFILCVSHHLAGARVSLQFAT
jgi:nucleosome binding factor SPN SPT16 subunit